MRRLAALFLLFSLFFTGCLHIGLASSLQDSRSLSSRGTIRYENVPSLQVFRAHGVEKLTKEQLNDVNLLAQSLDMYLSMSYRGYQVPQLHQINPNMKILLYRNVRAIKNYTDEWQMALDKDWMLKDSLGNLIHSPTWPTVYMVDIGNIEYQKWVANWIKGYLDKYGFDGVCSDNGFTAITGTWWGVTAQPINPRTGNLWTSDEAIEALCSLHYEIRRAIGSKLNIVNGIFEGSRFWRDQTKWMKLLSNCEIDGFFSEGLFNWNGFYSEDKWKESLDFVVWVQNNFLNQRGKIYCLAGLCAVDQIPDDCTTQQMAAFVFSSLLLGINKSQSYLLLQGAMLLDDVQNLFKIDLGVPKGDYYLIEGTHVYARDFTKVKVLVNSADEPYSVNLDGDYETLEGQIVSSINIEPHTGVILKVIF